MSVMTDQEIFDKVLKALREQRYASTVFGTSCRYRGRQGRKCAVGHLISDQDLLDYEGPIVCLPDAARESLGIMGDRQGLPMSPRCNFLKELQLAHDELMPVQMPDGSPDTLKPVTLGEWENRMRLIASNRSLIYSSSTL